MSLKFLQFIALKYHKNLLLLTEKREISERIFRTYLKNIEIRQNNLKLKNNAYYFHLKFNEKK